MTESTRQKKAKREQGLLSFLDEIKGNKEWAYWLNAKGNELHIVNVCREMARRMNDDAPWDGSFFRGTGWGVKHKNEFNNWVQIQFENKISGSTLPAVESTKSIVLPFLLDLNKLPCEIQKFLKNLVQENNYQKINIAELRSKINKKDRKILELKAQIVAVFDACNEHEDHYLHSIRSLSYD